MKYHCVFALSGCFSNCQSQHDSHNMFYSRWQVQVSNTPDISGVSVMPHQVSWIVLLTNLHMRIHAQVSMPQCAVMHFVDEQQFRPKLNSTAFSFGRGVTIGSSWSYHYYAIEPSAFPETDTTSKHSRWHSSLELSNVGSTWGTCFSIYCSGFFCAQCFFSVLCIFVWGWLFAFAGVFNVRYYLTALTIYVFTPSLPCFDGQCYHGLFT